MSFVDDQTPTQYALRRLVIQQDGEGNVTATFDVQLYNASGKAILSGERTVDLTSGQVDTLKTFLENKRTAFEDATGLTLLGSQ
jgi:hypothetical protein